MNKLIQKALYVITLMTIGVIAIGGKQIHAAGPTGGNTYLPIVLSPYTQSNKPTINIPYLAVSDLAASKLNEMSIFWFGQVRTDTNYADVRMGYNDQSLWIYMAAFDRLLWYNGSSNGSGLESWDAVTVVLNLDGNTQPTLPQNQSYRFVSQLRWSEGSTNYQKAYRGNGSTWNAQNIAFTTTSGWRGLVVNDNTDDRGWAMTFQIPYSSLGLTGKPANGTTWRLGVMLHDRDSAAGPALADQVWPANMNVLSPATWGYLRYGMPVYTPPAVTNPQVTTVRDKLNGQVVTDVSAGGGTICGGDGVDYFAQWGSFNYAGQAYFNIQNQVDIADWPCFSKYYVTFPLSQIPAGKVITSAKLSIYEFGGSKPDEAKPSLIQVMTVAGDWSETSLTWNNAPAYVENFAQRWVNVYTTNPPIWPGAKNEWDVSRAAAIAYQQGTPLRLVLYSADTDYHSGKYFVSSETGDWNAGGRPTLVVEWGTP